MLFKHVCILQIKAVNEFLRNFLQYTSLANVFTWWDARSPAGGPAWSPSGPTSTCWSRGWRTSCGTWTCRDLKQILLLLSVFLLESFNQCLWTFNKKGLFLVTSLNIVCISKYIDVTIGEHSVFLHLSPSSTIGAPRWCWLVVSGQGQGGAWPHHTRGHHQWAQ